jgi:ankyrin repeat protein
LDAYKFLGAYIGSLTGLQLAILKGNERIALDIIDSSLSEGDLDQQFGGGNTALHLATFYGMREVVGRLLERGADPNIKVCMLLCQSIWSGLSMHVLIDVSLHMFAQNNKGLRPIDILDDAEMRKVYESSTSSSSSQPMDG